MVNVGTSYPMRLDGNGKWVMDLGATRNKRLIASVLLTPIGSRADNPALGVFSDVVFRNTLGSNPDLRKFVLIEKIESAVSGVKVVDLTFNQVYDDDGTARTIIDLSFTDTEGNQSERVGIVLPTP